MNLNEKFPNAQQTLGWIRFEAHTCVLQLFVLNWSQCYSESCTTRSTFVYGNRVQYYVRKWRKSVCWECVLLLLFICYTTRLNTKCLASVVMRLLAIHIFRIYEWFLDAWIFASEAKKEIFHVITFQFQFFHTHTTNVPNCSLFVMVVHGSCLSFWSCW